MKTPAIFLDRDGTIIENRSYLSDPEQVRLLPGVAETIRKFSDAGFLVVLVSNQSGVARGLLTEEDLAKIHSRLESVLKGEGASLDASYYCPFLDTDDAVVEEYRQDSELRKPKPGMLMQAAEELNIDLAQSWMIGDSPSDIEAGARAGCRTVLVRSPESNIQLNGFQPAHVVPSIKEAIELVLPRERQGVASRPSSNPVDQSLHLLERMSTELERMTRPRKQRDFSLLLLTATLLQMLAIMVGLWGLIGLIDGGDTAARFSLACFLQIAALSAWAVDRFR